MERSQKRQYPRGEETEDLQIVERGKTTSLKVERVMDGEKIYYSLREAEQETGTPASTLRYWEKQFEQLNPRKDGHGNRYYTVEDMELIKRIKYIRDELHITRIEAIRRELKDDGKHSDSRQATLEILLRVKEELCEIRKMIK